MSASKLSEHKFNLQEQPHFIAHLMTLAAASLTDKEQKSLTNKKQESFERFARLFFRRYSFADVEGRAWQDIVEWALFLWRFVAEHRHWPEVNVWLPDDSRLSWQRPHTIIIIHQRDMPFLVDSVRIELVRRNIPIYSLKTMPYALDDQQRVTPIDQGQGEQAALIYLEVGFQENGDNQRGLQQTLREVIDQVGKVVGDHQALRQMTSDLADQLLQHEKQQTAETHAFLQWLLNDHFTFLAYSEFDLSDRQGKPTLVENRRKRLGLFANKTAARTKVVGNRGGVADFYAGDDLVAFSKSPEKSPVHRNAYPDYVVVKRFNSAGEVIGEARLLGLYTSSVYRVSPMHIPLVREKLRHIYEHMGLNLGSHEGKELTQVIETFPRDELFQFSASELQDTLGDILNISERYQVRLFLRRDSFGKFVSALVYIPRDIFSTRVREHLQRFLSRYLGAEDCEFNTWLSESVLARVHLVFRIRPSRAQPQDSPQRVEEKIADLIKPWRHKLFDKLIAARGEKSGREIYRSYGEAFSGAYEEFYSPSEALEDIARMEAMAEEPVSLSTVSAAEDRVRIKLFSQNSALDLARVIQVLEHMGLRVSSEHPFVVRLPEDNAIWLHDFQLHAPAATSITAERVTLMRDLFMAIWKKTVASDNFNQLVIVAGIDWRAVQLLRSYAGYLQQIVFPFTPGFMAEVLCRYATITHQLVDYFYQRFDPQLDSSEAREKSLQECEQKLAQALETIENLNEDRILRQYLALIQATVRCNFYQRQQAENFPPYLSFKFMPRDLAEVPEPRPLYEIYVTGQRMEGVHLRTAAVARGGLRWSDRRQDYRTETLGLVKTQQVKNAVIVPSGAKGGFVCKHADDLQGKALREEGLACYKQFISGLLTITDNLREGEIVPPPQMVRYDQDDPYLVVAADKGTASFSDTANELSADYDFWLGDAFASGGSQGYDHKAMGITARGAWISVWRHFMEKGHDVYRSEFTVVGIGDMGGDVFGNGMLLSKKIKLVAAFNHAHIFIDPDPDSEASWAERQRLFQSGNGGWDNYDQSLLSEGGGIFSRTEKRLSLTPQMRDKLGIEAEQLTPTELIHHLLQAPVDLIWNGGIGTYVKAKDESHQAVGDKANDHVRVTGSQLRCQVFGEGGNLGMTQRGRIEYALNGGACNTDFIDNSAGVDCSDHEVNIKILLNDRIKAGELTLEARNELLHQMTDEVAELVLDNNYQQTLAISLAQYDQSAGAVELRRFIQSLEAAGHLNRQLEALPDDDTLAERSAEACPLTRPELATLMAYAKMTLKAQLASTDVTADPQLADYCHRAFPQQLQERFADACHSHRLAGDIVATQLANAMVNQLGCTFAQRMYDVTGADALAIAQAYIQANTFYQASVHRQSLQELDFTLAPQVQLALMNKLAAKVRRGVRWLLRADRQAGAPMSAETTCMSSAQAVEEVLLEAVQPSVRQAYEDELQASDYAQVPRPLLLAIVSPGPLYTGLAVADICRETAFPLLQAGQVYVAVVEYLQLDVLARYLLRAHNDSYWQFLAQETFMDDLEAQAKALTQHLLQQSTANSAAQELIEVWAARHELLLQRWHTMMNAFHGSAQSDYAMFALTLRELADLVQVNNTGTGNKGD